MAQLISCEIGDSCGSELRCDAEYVAKKCQRCSRTFFLHGGTACFCSVGLYFPDYEVFFSEKEEIFN